MCLAVLHFFNRGALPLAFLRIQLTYGMMFSTCSCVKQKVCSVKRSGMKTGYTRMMYKSEKGLIQTVIAELLT